MKKIQKEQFKLYNFNHAILKEGYYLSDIFLFTLYQIFKKNLVSDIKEARTLEPLIKEGLIYFP